LSNPITYLDQAGQSRNSGLFGMLDMTAELALGRRERLWASVAAYGNGWDTEGRTSYAVLDATGALLERYDRRTESAQDGLTADFGLGFRRVVQPQQHDFSVELRGRSNGSDNENRSLKEPLALQDELPDLPTELRLQEAEDGNRELILQVDYVRPFGEGGKLEAGYRGSVRTTENDWLLRLFSPAEAPEPGDASGGDFLHREQFHSAYLTLAQRFGRLSLQGGVRAELASTRFEVGATGEGFDNDYTSIFPSVNLAYDLGGGRQARLTYSKRIERPHAVMLNPHVPTTDPLNRYAGNPHLQARYTHSLGMDLSWVLSAGNVRFAPYYRRTVDSWEQVREVDSAGVSTLTWQNIGSVEAYGATVTASLRQIGRVGGFVSVSGYREVWDVSRLSLGYSSRASFRWSASGNASVNPLPGLFTQVMVSYIPAREVPQGRISSA
jgi:ferric enterobactin receptor